MTIDELVISLGLDPSGVKSGMAEADRTVSGGMRKITTTIKSFVAPIAGMLAVGKLFNAYTSEATSIDRLSQSLGMSIERLQEWQGAARTVGVEAEEVGNLFRDMNDRITDAIKFDSGPLKEISGALGLALTDANDAARETEEILLDLADAFSSLSAQEATGLGMQLSINPNMIGLLQQGRGALEDLFRQQRELGIYTKQDAETAVKYTRALSDLWQSLKMGSAIIMRMVVPALSIGIGWFQKAIDFLRKHEKFVQIFFLGMATAITAYAIPALAKLAVAAATNPFTLLIAGAAALALVLEDLYVWMNGGKAALGEFWSLFGAPEEVKEGVEKFFSVLKAVASFIASVWIKNWKTQFNILVAVGKELFSIARYLWNLISPLAPLIAFFSSGIGLAYAFSAGIAKVTKAISFAKTAILGMRTAMLALNAAMAANPIGAVIAAIALAIAVSYALIRNWDNIKAFASKVWASVAETMNGAWERVKEGAQALWNGLVSIFGGIADWFSDKFSAAWEAIKGIFGGAVDWFKGIFDGIVDAITGPFTTAFEKIKSGWNAVKGIFGGKSDVAETADASPELNALPDAPSARGTLNAESTLGQIKGRASQYLSEIKPLFPGSEIRSTLLSGDASQAISPSSISNSSNSYNSDTSVNIGKVEISTQATDAEGISRDIGKGLKNNVAKFTVNQANAGVSQ